MKIKTNCALTIAGSDCSGGAGIEADLKTFSLFKVYGSAVITAIVAENTQKVYKVFPIPSKIVSLQIRSVMEDININSIKIGMIYSKENVLAISREIKKFKNLNIVLDPVIFSKDGTQLIKKNAIKALIEELFPISLVITPNRDEAEFLSGEKLNSEKNLDKILKKLFSFGSKYVLLKGGHIGKDATDYLYDGKEIVKIYGKRLKTKSTHGAGCTYSAAITALLSNGYSLLEAVKKAKDFIELAIKTAPSIGKGYHPLNHLIKLER